MPINADFYFRGPDPKDSRRILIELVDAGDPGDTPQSLMFSIPKSTLLKEKAINELFKERKEMTKDDLTQDILDGISSIVHKDVEITWTNDTDLEIDNPDEVAWTILQYVSEHMTWKS
jgi:hypothetical protein